MGENTPVQTVVPTTQATASAPSMPVANNTSGALASSGQPVEQTALPATFVPISTNDGKPVFVNVPGGNGTVKRACLVGYDTATGKAYCICSDTPQNRNAFVSSKQPKIDRTNEPTTDAIVQYHRDAHDVLSITIKNDALKSKVQNGKLVLSQNEANELVKKSSRTLMHVVDKKKENEQAQAVAEQGTKEEYKWYKDWKWWAGILAVLALTTVGILGFRKGGWWNKRKKGGNTPITPEPGPTTAEPVNPIDTEPGPTTAEPVNPNDNKNPVVDTTQAPTIGQNITQDGSSNNNSNNNNSADTTTAPTVGR